MRNKSAFVFRLVTVLTACALLNSGCDLLDTIIRAVGAACASSDITVVRRDDPAGGTCTSSDCSLRQAITLSNACPGTQTIHIASGMFLLSLAGAGEDRNRTGDLDITDSVNIVGGSHSAIIDGNNLDRVFDIHPGTTAQLTSLIVQHGRAPEGAGILSQGFLTLAQSSVSYNEAVDDSTRHFGDGAGILSTGPSLTLQGISVAHNNGGRGAGIAVRGSGGSGEYSFHMNNSSVVGNYGNDGAGLYIQSFVNAVISDFLITDNINSAGPGGGIVNHGRLSLTRGEISGNVAVGLGGSAVFDSGDLTMQNVLAQDNNTTGLGTIVHYHGGIATITDSAIVNNSNSLAGSPDEVGGVYNDFHMDIINSTISGNQGIAVENHGPMTITYSTIANDRVYGTLVGDGLVSVTMSNSILAGILGINCIDMGHVVSNGFNIENGNTCGLTGAHDLLSTDPLLQPLLNDGGTFVHPLAPGSPALDSADPAHCSGTDQRGVARPQGPACDRGAYELEIVARSLPITPLAFATVTSTPGAILLLLSKNTNCRSGPGTAYPSVDAYPAGQSLQVDGQSETAPLWWQVLIPNSSKHCWISSASGQPSGGDPSLLPVIHVAPPPTATPKPAGIDFDKDGFPAGPDCNDKNAKIHPGAPETAKDGIDSNCNGDDNK